MLQIAAIIGTLFIVYSIIHYLKGLNYKKIAINFLKLFIQAIMFVCGKFFYLLASLCQNIFERIELTKFDVNLATVRQISDALKITHSEAWKIYKEHHGEPEKKNSISIIPYFEKKEGIC